MSLEEWLGYFSNGRCGLIRLSEWAFGRAAGREEARERIEGK